MNSSPTYPTQTPETIDFDILRDLGDILGESDRQSCETSLKNIYKNDEKLLNDVRHSLYDIAKAECSDFPDGVLIKRVNRGGRSKSIPDKYAADIYLLFKYIKGAVPPHVIQTDVLSRQRTRYTDIGGCDNVYDVSQVSDPENMTNKSKINDFVPEVFNKLIAIHEEMKEKLDFVCNKLCDFQDKYELDMRKMIDAYEDKNNQLQHYVTETKRLQLTEERLKRDICSLKSDLDNKSKEIMHLKDQICTTISTIDKRACKIDGKIDLMNTRNKLMYSEAVKTPSPQARDDASPEPNTQAFPPLSNREDVSLSITIEPQDEQNNSTWDHDSDLGKQETIHSRKVNFNQQWKRVFSGASRFNSKRLVLSYIKADQPFEIVRDAIIDYAKDRGVTISKLSLLKHWKTYNPTYTIRIHVPNQGAKVMLEDDTFWPENVNCREWVPSKRWYVHNDDEQSRY